jgi:hypothetical protein
MTVTPITMRKSTAAAMTKTPSRIDSHDNAPVETVCLALMLALLALACRIASIW